MKESKHYTIDRGGNVYSYLSNRYLKPNDNNGYKMVYLKQDDGAYKWFYIHRLVANNFISNPDNKAEVNHKDGDKGNNHVDNLEWCTKSENHLHAHKIGLKKGNRKKGFKHSPESIQKMKASKQGTKHPRFKGWYITPLGAFTSSYNAAKAYKDAGIKMNAKTIYNRCKVKACGNFYFVDKKNKHILEDKGLI